MKEKILEFLKANNETWKLVEVASALNVEVFGILQDFFDLEKEGLIEMGGQTMAPWHIKFVRLKPDYKELSDLSKEKFEALYKEWKEKEG